MTPREVCFLVAHDGRVLWSDASESPLALPDSRARWDAIWQHREALLVIAHSHPVGPQAFSEEDVSTMDALDAALGKAMTFAVVAPKGLVCRGPNQVSEGAAWVAALRTASGM